MHISLAHSQRHHASHLFAGVSSATSSLFYAPFYPRGFGKVVSMFPAAAGRKAAGFFNPNVDSRLVVSPFWMQVRKILSVLRGNTDFERVFDVWFSGEIKKGRVGSDVFVFLQDYMPRSVDAALASGALIWSDQILNSSRSSIDRMAEHCERFGVVPPVHDESVNDGILSVASVITSPSSFVDQGLAGRFRPQSNIFRARYGVDLDLFFPRGDYSPDPDVLRILVRGNSVRKGGHLFLSAMLESFGRFLRDSGRKRIEVRFVGSVAPELLGLLERCASIDGCFLSHGDVVHRDLPKIFSESDFLVMPTLAEGMSLIIPEALACGLPVVTTEYCGVDCIEDGCNGIFVSDNTESLSDGISRMIEMQEDYKSLRERCSKSVSGYGWSQYSAAIAKVVTTLS